MDVVTHVARAAGVPDQQVRAAGPLHGGHRPGGVHLRAVSHRGHRHQPTAGVTGGDRPVRGHLDAHLLRRSRRKRRGQPAAARHRAGDVGPSGTVDIVVQHRPPGSAGRAGHPKGVHGVGVVLHHKLVAGRGLRANGGGALLPRAVGVVHAIAQVRCLTRPACVQVRLEDGPAGRDTVADIHHGEVAGGARLDDHIPRHAAGHRDGGPDVHPDVHRLAR